MDVPVVDLLERIGETSHDPDFFTDGRRRVESALDPEVSAELSRFKAQYDGLNEAVSNHFSWEHLVSLLTGFPYLLDRIIGRGYSLDGIVERKGATGGTLWAVEFRGSNGETFFVDFR